MPRQLVRLSAVRTPQKTDDNYTSAQIQGAEAESLTTQDYIQYILSQIRLIQGTQSWKQPPAANLVTVAATMDQVQAEMAQVASLAAQVTQLSQKLDSDEQDFVTQAQIAAINTQITSVTTQLQTQFMTSAAQMQTLMQTVTSLQAAQAQQAVMIAGFIHAHRPAKRHYDVHAVRPASVRPAK